ncbi:MAG: pyrroline-5-carboxylate reductase dimerization domain-containing protein [Legionellaceae bacterium]|nr:pyrroline-5-carboxylate reductase dimerization domain-containing protein [Legionellaceae bacterium]
MPSLPKINSLWWGFGGISGTVVRAAVRHGVLSPANVGVYSRRIARGEWETPYNNLSEKMLGPVIEQANMIVFSVPPSAREQVYEGAAKRFGSSFADKLVIDMSAAPHQGLLKSCFPRSEIVAVMASKATEYDKGFWERFEVTELSDENDAILTHVFGAGAVEELSRTLAKYDRDTVHYSTGVGAVLLFAEAMIEADIRNGGRPTRARFNTERLFAAVAEMLQKNPELTISELVDKVASVKPVKPGEEKISGTTAEVAASFAESDLKALVHKGFSAGIHRTAELRAQFGGGARKKKHEASFLGQLAKENSDAQASEARLEAAASECERGLGK